MTNAPNTPPPPSEILTLKDVAAYLKLAERTVYLYAQTGKLPGIKIGSAWRFRRSEIDQWLDAQRRITETSTRMHQEPKTPQGMPDKEDRPLPLEVESSTLNVESSKESGMNTGNIQRSTSNVQRSTEDKEDAP